MLIITLPGRDMTLELKNMVLDLNGTLTTDGVLEQGVQERINILKEKLDIYLLTSDTLGSGAKIAEFLGIPFFKVGKEQGQLDKKDFVGTLDAKQTVAIGNGYNDALMLEDAALAIVVIGSEGGCVKALSKADIVVNNIVDALEMIVNPVRVVATLRG